MFQEFLVSRSNTETFRFLLSSSSSSSLPRKEGFTEAEEEKRKIEEKRSARKERRSQEKLLFFFSISLLLSLSLSLSLSFVFSLTDDWQSVSRLPEPNECARRPASGPVQLRAWLPSSVAPSSAYIPETDSRSLTRSRKPPFSQWSPY